MIALPVWKFILPVMLKIRENTEIAANKIEHKLSERENHYY